MKRQAIALALSVCLCFSLFFIPFNVSAYTYGTAYRFSTNDVISEADLYAYINYNVSYPHTIETDYDYVVDTEYTGASTYPYPYYNRNTYSDSSVKLYEVTVPVTVNIQNNGTYLYRGGNSYIQVNVSWQYTYTPSSFYVTCDSNDYVLYDITNNFFRVKPINPYLSYEGLYALPAGTNTSFTVTFHFLYEYYSTHGSLGNSTSGTAFDSNAKYLQANDNTFALNNPATWTAYPDITASYNDVINFGNIHSDLTDIIDILSGDSSTSEDVINESEDVAATNDTIHAQEQEWYSQNEQALEASGLSNYEFNGSQISALGQVKTLFENTWTAIGDWSLIYIFVLTLSLATFILRHRPATKSSQYTRHQE